MSTRERFLCAVVFLAILATGMANATAQSAQAPIVVVAVLADVIHPVTAEYVVESLAAAAANRADLFVLQLDTPGGLDQSMRSIIQAILSSPVPVVVFVGPAGARAASAGFFMAMAADHVAMAPGTNMGAASPVAVGGGEIDETMQRKLIQDAEAYMRSLAASNERPLDLAAEAVTVGRSFAAEEALRNGLADLSAADVDDLLAQLDGTEIGVGDRRRTIRVAGAQQRLVEMSLRQRVLAVIANPQVAYFLMLIAAAGLYFELSTPGAILPGVVGGVSLVLSLLAFQILPINFAGLALMGLAVLFFILEIKVTSYGLLTIAGLVAFVLGSLMLIPGPIPELRLQLGFVLPAALGVLGIAGFLVSLVLRAHREQVRTGAMGLIHEVGRVVNGLTPGEVGSVFVHGEIWRARSDIPLTAGTPVEVTAVEDGMVVRVQPRTSQEGD